MFRFQQFGRTCQLRIETVDDLENILSLDDALWMATSAPVAAFGGDPRFLEHLDVNKSGRVTSDNLREAVGWLLNRLSDRRGIEEARGEVRLDAINTEQLTEGDDLILSARYVLKVLGKPEDASITLGQVTDFLADLQAQPLNGNGVLIAEACEDTTLRDLILAATACTGGTQDGSGRKGITTEQLGAFRQAVKDLAAWREKDFVARRDNNTTTFPLGDNTSGAYAVYRQHAAEVDRFFDLCELLCFDPRAAQHVGCSDAEWAALDFTKSEQTEACLAKSPIARLGSEADLPLCGAVVNPIYRDWLSRLKKEVLDRVLDISGASLTAADWRKVKERLAPYETHANSKKGDMVESLDEEALQRYQQAELYERAARLIDADIEVATIRRNVTDIEKLLLFQKNMMRFTNNFVSFTELYTASNRALFEVGSAVIDGRWFNLALHVDDVKGHASVATSSGIFIIYIEVTPVGKPAYSVALPATSGSKGNLGVGKRGVFIDLDKVEHDARIVRVIDNPVSVREAVTAPFVRLWQFILGKLETISSSTEKDLQKQTDAMMNLPPPSAASKLPGGPAGMLVGLSVSAAAVGSSLAFITKTFAELTWRQILGGIGMALLIVMIPAALVAVFRLRRQDLSSLLEGCGWAINARMRLNRAQRGQFTKRAAYPLGSIGIPRSRWLMFILLGALAALLLALVRQHGWCG